MVEREKKKKINMRMCVCVCVNMKVQNEQKSKKEIQNLFYQVPSIFLFFAHFKFIIFHVRSFTGHTD